MGKQFSISKALKGMSLQNQGQMSSHDFAKKLRNYVFDGTVKGRQKQTTEGELFTLHSLFLLALPIPFSNLLPSSMFQS
jgi:hypothetical protein